MFECTCSKCITFRHIHRWWCDFLFPLTDCQTLLPVRTFGGEVQLPETSAPRPSLHMNGEHQCYCNITALLHNLMCNLHPKYAYQVYTVYIIITERSEVYTGVDRVFVRFLCELLKLRSCLLEGVQLHRWLQGCQTKWPTFTKIEGSHKSTVVPDSKTHQVNFCVDLK